MGAAGLSADTQHLTSLWDHTQAVRMLPGGSGGTIQKTNNGPHSLSSSAVGEFTSQDLVGEHVGISHTDFPEGIF